MNNNLQAFDQLPALPAIKPLSGRAERIE